MFVAGDAGIADAAAQNHVLVRIGRALIDIREEIWTVRIGDEAVATIVDPRLGAIVAETTLATTVGGPHGGDGEEKQT